MKLKNCQWSGQAFTATFEIGNDGRAYTVSEIEDMLVSIRLKCQQLNGRPNADVRRRGKVCMIRLDYDQEIVSRIFQQTAVQQLGLLVEEDVHELLPDY